jgi:hypothetical protein
MTDLTRWQQRPEDGLLSAPDGEVARALPSDPATAIPLPRAGTPVRQLPLPPGGHGPYTDIVRLCVALLEHGAFFLSAIELDIHNVHGGLDGEQFERDLRQALAALDVETAAHEEE